MADINISVQNNLFTITLDKWEWTGLNVNSSPVPRYTGPNPNIQFQYVEQTSGAIHFTATANQFIDLVNPGSTLFMKGAGNSTYMCVISYMEKNNVITLNGTLLILPYSVPDAQPSPITFSQGRMTGTFQLQ